MNVIETLRRMAKAPRMAYQRVTYTIDWPALLAEVQRLQALVDKLPKTEDGVPVTSSDDVYELIDGKTIVHSKAGRLMWPVLWPVYSTREAAEAAAKKGQ